MTPERLAQLRDRVIFATYHVPDYAIAERDALKDADAGEDMLELCDAVAVASELLAALKRIVACDEHDPDGLRDTWRDLTYRSIEIARTAIAKAEGR
jgi:hypothetical protein